MKKFTLLVAALMATMFTFAEVITITDFMSVPLVDEEADWTVTVNGITLSSRGTIADATYAGVTNRTLRVFAGNTLTISAEKTMTKIEVIGYAKKDADITANPGTVVGGQYSAETYKNVSFDDPLFVINNVNATSTVVTPVKQIRVYGIRVTFGEGSTPGGDEGGVIEQTINDGLAVYYEKYSSKGAENFEIHLMNTDESGNLFAPYLVFDCYMERANALAGTYSQAAGNLEEEYSVAWLTDVEANDEEADGHIVSNVSLKIDTIGKDDEGDYMYNIEVSYTSEGKKYHAASAMYIYAMDGADKSPIAIDEAGTTPIGDEGGDEGGDYSWEPTEKTNITAAYTSADYIFEDGQLDVYMSNDDSALELLFNVSALNETTIVPVGTYQINNTMAEGTVMASPGGDDYYDYPSVYTTDYNEAGYYSTAYYLVSGTVTVSQEGEDLKIVVNATTYNGSTINATMMGAITEYEGGGDGENDYSAEPTATTTINASFTSGEYVFYEEYSELDLTLENDDATLELAFNVSALDPTTVIPVGIYEISDTYAEGTVTASAGAFDFLGFALSLPSVYSVYDDEYNETPYYLVGGTVTVSQEGENLKIVVNATSYNGSTINATMIGKISEYGAIDDAVRNIEVDNNVFARNGRIFCDEAARIYSVNGMDVTRMNGNLEGIYIVKNGNKVSKVVVTK